jgi:hypothetical protein
MLDVVAQRIVVRWTKASRGAPGAVKRNAVPEGFAFDFQGIADLDAVAVVERLSFDEAREFRIQQGSSSLETVEMVERGTNVRLLPVGEDLQVTRLPMGGASLAYPPALRQAKSAFTLTPGSWGRLRANARFGSGWDGDWSYEKVVWNVAWKLDMPRGSTVFVDTQPAAVLDELVSLR